MNIIVSRHVFGSIRGYTTLAKSSDLSPEQISKLEILSFGQTNEPSYLDSLQTNPAYISRPLCSEKWAVTRIFKGNSDDHNRTTLLFISAIVSIRDWLYSLKCDVNKLLYNSNLWQWNGEEKLKSIEISVESKKEIPGMEIRNKVLSLLGAVEKYTNDEDTTIVVKESEFDGKILRFLNMVLPLTLKQTFSCTARSLNDGLPFSLISMAKEGSFGNSKRRTVNWTLDSVVDDCLYADSIAEFWQAQGHPPWQFIDSCKSFLIDLEGEAELKSHKRRLTSKPLSDEIANARIGRKKYLSRKLSVILFTCFIVAGIATVITVGAMRVKAKKVKTSFIEGRIREAKVFLAQNSSSEYFPANITVIKQIIQQSKDLIFQLEELLDVTDDPELKNQLKIVCINLGSLQNLTNDVYNKCVRLENERQLAVNFELTKNPVIYPIREDIVAVEELRERIKNIDTTKLALKYVSDAKNILQNIDRWKMAIGTLLETKKDKVIKNIQSDIFKTSPDHYSEKRLRDYSSFKRILDDLKNDESLTNAKDSPIKEHKKIAKAMIEKLNEHIVDYEGRLKDLVDLKKKAEDSFEDANSILSDPNIKDGSVENLTRLCKVKSLLGEVHKLWPGKPNLEKGEEKLGDRINANRKIILGEWEKKIPLIDDHEPNDAGEAEKVKKLIRDYPAMQKKLEVVDIQNIDDDVLEQIKNYDKELTMCLPSTSKTKKKEIKKSK